MIYQCQFNEEHGIEAIINELSTIPPKIKELDFSEKKLANRDLEELKSIFKSISPNIVSINLKDNGLFALAPNFHIFLDAIPKTVRTLNLGYNELNQVKSKEDLCNIARAIPSNIVNINLGGNNLGVLGSELIGYLFDNFHPYLTILNLEDNALGTIRDDDFGAALTKLKPNITHLILAQNALYKMNISNLKLLFSGFPRALSYLDLSTNGLSSIQENNLSVLFNLLPPELKTLDIKSNFDDNFPVESFQILLASIPDSVTSLYLGNNFLDHRTTIELEDILSAIKPTVSELDLSEHHFFTKEPADLYFIFSALPKTVSSLFLHHCRLNDLNKEKIDILKDKLSHLEQLTVSLYELKNMDLTLKSDFREWIFKQSYQKLKLLDRDDKLIPDSEYLALELFNFKKHSNLSLLRLCAYTMFQHKMHVELPTNLQKELNYPYAIKADVN